MVELTLLIVVPIKETLMSCVALLLDRNILSKFIGMGSKNIDHSVTSYRCVNGFDIFNVNKPFVKSSSASKTWGGCIADTIDMLMASILGL